ncbi:threonine/serine dehydratase [Parvularcula sp. IMCC14364]|uniref:threonine ammonia-lyase n=1 Tax=Parvularcula sp. IMCC14364 TaxID=3067902 RepID=UPI002741F1D0|nr:threonine/serine dehydratase [Parvularcula sp. IMCC14364]
MVSFSDITAAAERLVPFITRTPLLESPRLNARLGGRLLVKAESLQKTGSFKFRGATNRISQLTPQERAAGVVAWSSGNHAQGVALAAMLHHVPATIVMPEDAPQVKINNTSSYGAEVVLYDRYGESREEIGTRIAREKGAIIVPPFDDPHIIAGQGTVGLELAVQAQEQGITLDDVVICFSGGGLSAGCAVALAALSPAAKLWVAEPTGFDDAGRSLRAGHPLQNAPGGKSICDALLQPTPGALTFPILSASGAGGVSASDEEALAAMKTAFEEFKLVLEPGGAIALACALSGRLDIKGRTICAVATGGNVDTDLFKQCL